MSVRRPVSPTARQKARPAAPTREAGGRRRAGDRRGDRPAAAARSAGTVRTQTQAAPRGLSRRAAVYLALVLAVLVSLLPSLRAYVKQQQELSDLRADVAAKQAQVNDLNSQLARWRDDAYVIAKAREQFTYVFPGEVGYIVRDEPRAVTDTRDPAGAAARKASAATGPWYSTLWGSVNATSRIQPQDVNR